jgi:tetratricopeptide (TPR) repeat protein
MSRILLLSLLLVSFLPGSAAANTWDNCNQTNDLELSIKACSGLIENATLNDKNHSFAFDYRCWAYIQKRDFDRALSDCNQALELNPRYAEALTDRCLIYLRKYLYDLSISDCNKAIELESRKARAYGYRCFAFHFKGDHDRALSDCNRSLEIDPKAMDGFNGRCAIYRAKGQYDLAIAACNKAIDIDPKYGYTYWRRGSVLQDKGSYAAALSDLNKARELISRSDSETHSDIQTAIREVEAKLSGAPTAVPQSDVPNTVAGSAVKPAPAVPAESQEPVLDSEGRQAIQRHLKVLGFYESTIDGSFGPRTRKAIGAFQKTNDLEATGYLDLSTIGLLKRKAAAREQELAAQETAVAPAPATPSVPEQTQPIPVAAADIADPAAKSETAGQVPQPLEAVAPGTAEPQPSTLPTETPVVDFSAVIATLQPIDDVFVAIRPAKVRAIPNVAAKASETLAVGERIQVLGRLPEQDWYLVARDGSPIGYVVASQLVSEVEYATTQAPPATEASDTSLPVEGPASFPPELAALDFGRYYALVIGNNEYESVPKLRMSVKDAQAVADMLQRQYDFEVETLLDATRNQIIASLSALRKRLTAEDNLLIYYAGHGVYDEAADRGYWLPIDAAHDSPANWVSNADITDMIKAMQAKHVMIVADSCYSGTLTRGLSIVLQDASYIRRMVKKRGRTVLTSGGLEPVLDAGGEGHSVFARAFIDVLKENGGVLDGQQLFARVREPVTVNSEQTPEYGNIRFAGHDGGDFLFVRTN